MALDEAFYQEIVRRLKFDPDFTSFLKSRAEVDSPQITKDNILGLGALLALVDQTKDRKFSFGQATLTWGGVTAKSNVLTVNHGLGVAPAIVVATQTGGTAPGFFVIFVWGNGTSTSFDIAGAPPSGIPVAAATAFFSWLAVG